MFVERYRPKNLSEVIGKDSVIAKIQNTIKNGELEQNILLYGPPGNGKTSTALCICKDIFGEDYWKLDTLELNASQENSAETIRTKVIDACRYSTHSGKKKIIFLDECDALSERAQEILKRTMETYSNNARFILTCNRVWKVIDAVQSRCAKYSFDSPSQEAIVNRLKYICEQEKIVYKISVLEFIADRVNGDIRNAIQIVEQNQKNGLMDIESLELGSIIIDVEPMVKALESRNIKQAKELFKNIRQTGRNCSDILIALSNFLIENRKIESPNLVYDIADCDYKILVGATMELQLDAVLWKISNALVEFGKK
jgi:replication factor C small subunit